MAEPDFDDNFPDTQVILQFLTYRLSRVHSKLNAQANKILNDQAGIGLSQWRIIALIGTAEKVRSSELSRAAALDKGLVSRNLKTMIADGIVASEPDPEDHRAHNLRLTPKGMELFHETLPHMRRRQQHLTASLTRQEEAVLRTALDKLEAAAARTEFPS